MKHISSFIILAFFVANLVAQEPVPLPDKSGTWTYGYLNDENTKMYIKQFGMSAEEASVFRNKLDHMVEVLHGNPVMANPKGFDAVVDSRPYYPYGHNTFRENYGYVGEINFRLCPWFQSKGKEYKQSIEPPRVTVYTNQIRLLKNSAFNVAGPEGAEIRKAELLANDICKPMRIKELAPGVVLYDASIVVTKPGKQVFLPCTVAEAYKRLMNYYELASRKEPAFGYILDGIKKEYATLTSVQLEGPAYYGGMFSGITPVKNEDPLFLFNYDFFDRSMPKTAIQIVIFPIDADYFRKESDFASNSVGFARINRFLHTLDLNAISKFID